MCCTTNGSNRVSVYIAIALCYGWPNATPAVRILIRVRGVEGNSAKHLTIKFYTMVMLMLECC